MTPRRRRAFAGIRTAPLAIVAAALLTSTLSAQAPQHSRYRRRWRALPRPARPLLPRVRHDQLTLAALLVPSSLHGSWPLVTDADRSPVDAHGQRLRLLRGYRDEVEPFLAPLLCDFGDQSDVGCVVFVTDTAWLQRRSFLRKEHI